jgi:heat shock protein HslJ
VWLENWNVYSMKHLILASLILSVLSYRFQASSFPKNLSYQISVTDTTIEGKWKLMPVLASDTSAGKIPEINFDLKTNKFFGNTGCNAMSGNFVINKDALTFNENIITTKMACSGYNEKAFLQSLIRTNRYQIKNGVLQLMYNTTVLSKWVRHTDNTPTKQI